MSPGMHRLGVPGRKPDGDDVEDGQHDGDREPDPGLEGHRDILSRLPPLRAPVSASATR